MVAKTFPLIQFFPFLIFFSHLLSHPYKKAVDCSQNNQFELVLSAESSSTQLSPLLPHEEEDTSRKIIMRFPLIACILIGFVVLTIISSSEGSRTRKLRIAKKLGALLLLHRKKYLFAVPFPLPVPIP